MTTITASDRAAFVAAESSHRLTVERNARLNHLAARPHLTVSRGVMTTDPLALLRPVA